MSDHQSSIARAGPGVPEVTHPPAGQVFDIEAQEFDKLQLSAHLLGTSSAKRPAGPSQRRLHRDPAGGDRLHQDDADL